jgi:hypothetical protein
MKPVGDRCSLGQDREEVAKYHVFQDHRRNMHPCREGTNGELSASASTVEGWLCSGGTITPVCHLMCQWTPFLFKRPDRAVFFVLQTVSMIDYASFNSRIAHGSSRFSARCLIPAPHLETKPGDLQSIK